MGQRSHAPESAAARSSAAAWVVLRVGARMCLRAARYIKHVSLLSLGKENRQLMVLGV